ncbi:MAG: MGMT family protein [Deltaproteobacteria bacterium]|nr:MGMT family protein [Deltaproteobacteria bacterium]
MARRAEASWESIYEAVSRIPRGRVSTYGRVAKAAGRPGHARQVGYALAGLGAESDVPWHRVVSASGRLSLPGEAGELQAVRLALEGVLVVDGKVNLSRILFDF